jgi:hypothetical protein
LVSVPIGQICDPADWKQLLAGEEDAVELGRLRHATRTGRPCGDASFVEQMEQRLGRRLRPAIGGRPVRGHTTVPEVPEVPEGSRGVQRGTVPEGDSHQVFSLSKPPNGTEFDNKTW